MNITKIRGIATVATALIVAGTALPAAAQTQNNVVSQERAATGGTSASAARSERRICVRAEMPASRVARNVCKTQAEWNREGGVPRADD